MLNAGERSVSALLALAETQIEICTLNGSRFLNLYPFDMFSIIYLLTIQAYFSPLNVTLKVQT